MAGLTAQQISNIEHQLGKILPDEVRNIYADSNGLRGPTGIWFLYPHSDDPHLNIIRVNKTLKNEEWFPEKIRDFIIIGDDGCGGLICASKSQNIAAIWYPQGGDEFQDQRQTVREIWDLIS